MGAIDIRPATIADLPRLAPLMEELRLAMARLNPAATPPAPAAILSQAEVYLRGPYNLIMLALAGEEAVGFIRVNARRGESFLPLPGRGLPLGRRVLERFRRWRRRREGVEEAAAALYLADLYLRPERRRQGLGRTLVREALARFSAVGAEMVYLFVVANNDEGIRFWTGLGFAPESVLMMRRGPTASGPEAIPREEGKGK